MKSERLPRIEALRYIMLGAAIGRGQDGYAELVKARPVKLWPKAWQPVISAMGGMLSADDKGKPGAVEAYVNAVVQLLEITRPKAGKLLPWLFATWQKLERAEGYGLVRDRVGTLSVLLRAPDGGDNSRHVAELRELAELLEGNDNEKREAKAGKTVGVTLPAPGVGSGHGKATPGNGVAGVVGTGSGPVANSGGNGGAAGRLQDVGGRPNQPIVPEVAGAAGGG